MTGRSTAIRDRHRAVIRQGQPPCHICSTAIDYSLPYLHPLSFVVDHVIPLNRGGLDVIENKAAAHRSCNRTKSDKVEGDNAPTTPRTREYVTSRTW